MEKHTLYRTMAKSIQTLALLLGIIIPLVLSGCAKTVPGPNQYVEEEVKKENILTSEPYNLTKGNLQLLSFPFESGAYYTLAAFEENLVCGIMFATVTTAFTVVGLAALPVSFTVDTVMLPFSATQ